MNVAALILLINIATGVNQPLPHTPQFPHLAQVVVNNSSSDNITVGGLAGSTSISSGVIRSAQGEPQPTPSYPKSDQPVPTPSDKPWINQPAPIGSIPPTAPQNGGQLGYTAVCPDGVVASGCDTPSDSK